MSRPMASMPSPPLPDKEYFSMGEASRIAQVPMHTLRYWEKHFGGLRPSRKSGGHRRYSRADLELIFQIKDLVQRKRLTIAGARKTLSARRRPEADGKPGAAGEGVSQSTLKVLNEVRKELKALVEELGK